MKKVKKEQKLDMICRVNIDSRYNENLKKMEKI